MKKKTFLKNRKDGKQFSEHVNLVNTEVKSRDWSEIKSLLIRKTKRQIAAGIIQSPPWDYASKELSKNLTNYRLDLSDSLR